MAFFVPRRSRRNSRRCLAHPRAHSGTELSKKRRGRKRHKGKPGRDSEEELHEAAPAQAREEEDEFFQVVPQDETMKERHGEETSGDA